MGGATFTDLTASYDQMDMEDVSFTDEMITFEEDEDESYEEEMSPPPEDEGESYGDEVELQGDDTVPGNPTKSPSYSPSISKNPSYSSAPSIDSLDTTP